jgi:hypothetical protein
MAKKSRSNPQIAMLGMSPDVGGLLRQKAAAPIKPRKPQVPCDIGLFSDDADQMDLVEMFQEPVED